MCAPVRCCCVLACSATPGTAWPQTSCIHCHKCASGLGHAATGARCKTHHGLRASVRVADGTTRFLHCAKVNSPLADLFFCVWVFGPRLASCCWCVVCVPQVRSQVFAVLGHRSWVTPCLPVRLHHHGPGAQHPLHCQSAGAQRQRLGSVVLPIGRHAHHG